MSQAQSYYELLGVSRTATADEIRAAYVRLMKRHHPDAAARHDGAPDFASLLNRCYAVLRDPVKRSQHDSQLFATSPMPVMPPRLHHPARRRGKGRSGQVVVLLGAVAFAFSWVALNLGGEQTTWEFAATAAGWVPRPPLHTSNTALPLPNPAVTQRVADRARTVSTRDAEHLSRECFARASRQLHAAIADSCVLFDTAFLYWRTTPVSTSTFPAYFADQVVDDRHKELAIAYGATADERLAALREMAFQALIQGLQVPLPDRATSSRVGDHTFTPPELREGERERLAEANVPQWGTLPLGREHKALDLHSAHR